MWWTWVETLLATFIWVRAPFRFQYLLAIQRRRKIVDSPPHILLFLSGQAASHIPEFPSFFHTNMYTQRVQLFPLEGSPVRVEINVSFLCMFILSSCHKNTNPALPPSFRCVWCWGSHFLINTLGEQLINLSLSSLSHPLRPRLLSSSYGALMPLFCRRSALDWWRAAQRVFVSRSDIINHSFSYPLSVSVTLCCPLTFPQLSVVQPISFSSKCVAVLHFVHIMDGVVHCKVPDEKKKKRVRVCMGVWEWDSSTECTKGFHIMLKEPSIQRGSGGNTHTH